MKLLISIPDSTANIMARKLLPTEGICLGGRILSRTLPLLESEIIKSGFTAKGVLRELLKDMPVYKIKNSEGLLLGAACFGFAGWRLNGKNGMRS